jgi:NAD-dependent dihydropyrimidine dehydrogenase PreA subunit
MADEKELKELKVEDIKKKADETGCPVQRALYYVSEFLFGPMCGRCFPCSMGSYEARIILRNIIAGKGSADELDNLKRIASLMIDSSMCKKGKDTAKFILEWMDSGVFSKHIEDGLCPERMCCNYVEYRIIPEKCIICGLCKDACQYDAIHGEKKKPFLSGYKPYEIRQQKCTKCSECIKVCPTGAIILADKKVKEPVGV